MSVNRCDKRPSDTATVIQTTSFNVPPARWSVFSRFLKACRTCASKFPAREDPLSSTNPTWPASHMVLPPSVMTAGENEYFASQDGSRIVFFSAISISTKALAHGLVGQMRYFIGSGLSWLAIFAAQRHGHRRAQKLHCYEPARELRPPKF